MKSKESGLTLIELLVVTSLLIILGMMAWGAYRFNIMRSHDSKRKADLTELRRALYSFHDDNGRFPLDDEFGCGQSLDPYIEVIPCDPTNNDTYYYGYHTDVGGSFFRITAVLESGGEFTVLSENANFDTGTEEEGVQPTCGGSTKACLPNVCSSCCPGANYRCNARGNLCIFDNSCDQVEE